MDYNAIYRQVEIHVTGLYANHPNPSLIYHNLQHTLNVVNRTKEVAGHYHLTEQDTLVLYVAAWFHDTGHLVSEPQNHEVKSVELMRAFMLEYTTDEDTLHTIEECILATRMFVTPVNLLQQILCDADTYHFGTKDFKVTNMQMYEEIKLKGNKLGKKEFYKGGILLLKSHQFYTSYAKDLLTEGKMENIKKLKKALKADKVKQEEIPMPTANNPVIKEQNNFTTKGIQTMLRLTSENHMKLSDMADGKANILISVNAIIISVILTVLLRRLQIDTYLTIPTVIFLMFTLMTIIIAILATRPKVTEGTFSHQDILDKKANLLFFGNFHKTTLEAYETAMQTMMNDPDYLYSSLIKDIFHLGVVLARKYRLIRLAYNIFMVGIIISVLAFAIAAVIGTPAEGTISDASGIPL